MTGMDRQDLPMKTVVNLPQSAAHDVPAPPLDMPASPGTSPGSLEPSSPASAHYPRRDSRVQPAPMALSAPHSPFVPLLLGGLALLGWLGFQTQQLVNERAALAGVHASQQLTVDNAGKLRGSLDALAADTQRIADAGNPNARLLVEELRKRGITINAAASGAAGQPATR